MLKRIKSKLNSYVSKIRTDDNAADRLQNIVIALLTVCAAAMLVWSGLFNVRTVTGENDQSGQQSAQASGETGTEINAAGPYVIAVTEKDGSHCGIMNDGTELGQAYERLSAYLGEALGSAGEPESVTRQEWESALKRRGIFYNFGYEQPLSLIASTLSTSMTSRAADHNASLLCISTRGTEVYLFYRRTADGDYYRCLTAINPSSMDSRLSDWTPNGALFLFESDYDYNLVDRSFLIMPQQAQMHTVIQQNPIASLTDASAITDVLGLNSYMATNYTEADGTQVYVDGTGILRIFKDGRVQFNNPAPAESSSEEVSMRTALNIAGSAVDKTVGANTGLAAVKLSYVGYNSDEHSYTVRYTYEIGNYLVSLGMYNAAEITVTRGIITQAQLCYRQYSYSGGDDAPLPCLQAMAVVQAKGGGMPVLCYQDDGAAVTAGWTKVN